MDLIPLQIWSLYLWLHFPASCPRLLGGWLQKLLFWWQGFLDIWRNTLWVLHSCVIRLDKVVQSRCCWHMCCQSAQMLALLGQFNQLLCTDWGNSPLGSCFWGWRESLQEFKSLYLSFHKVGRVFLLGHHDYCPSWQYSLEKNVWLGTCFVWNVKFTHTPIFFTKYCIDCPFLHHGPFSHSGSGWEKRIIITLLDEWFLCYLRISSTKETSSLFF